MTENTVTTHQCEAVRWMPCPCELAGLQPLSTCVCEGTGLRFSGLSKPCQPHFINCLCGGVGRTRVDTLEAFLEAVRSLHNLDEYSLSWCPVEEGETEPPYEVALWLDGEKYSPMGAGCGDSFQEAIANALCKNAGLHVV